MRVRHFLTSSLVSDLDPCSRDSHPSLLVTNDARCTEAGQIYQAAEIAALDIAKDIRASTCITKASAIVPFSAPEYLLADLHAPEFHKGNLSPYLHTHHQT